MSQDQNEVKPQPKLYRIWSFESTEGNGDRNEIGRVKAYNMDEAVEHVKKEYVKEEYRDKLEEEGDDEQCILSMITTYDANGDPISDDDEYDEEYDNMVTEGYQIEEIEEYTESDESFKLITGENNFVDLTKKESA